MNGRRVSSIRGIRQGYIFFLKGVYVSFSELCRDMLSHEKTEERTYLSQQNKACCVLETSDTVDLQWVLQNVNCAVEWIVLLHNFGNQWRSKGQCHLLICLNDMAFY